MNYMFLLPCELIQMIAQRVDVRSFGRWMLTCKRIQEYLDDEHLWKRLYNRDVVFDFNDHLSCGEMCWELVYLKKDLRNYSYKKKITHLLHPYTLGTTPCHSIHDHASSFYILLRCLNWMTRAEWLRLCVLTIAGRKYVFLAQLRNWNYATSSSVRLDLILLDSPTSHILVKGNWLFEWIPTYIIPNLKEACEFSKEETDTWLEMPTQPMVPLREILHDPKMCSRDNVLYIRGNKLIEKEFLSVRLVDIPVFKLRASVIRISQNYRFLTTLVDYGEVVAYIRDTWTLLDNEII